MSELRELYQEVILDHNRRPRNFHKLDAANRKAEGYNPLCGDRLTVYLMIEDDAIKDASFEGSGCAISKACASMMTDAVKGRTVAEAERLFEQFHRMVTSSPEQPSDGGDLVDLGKLSVFAGVREFPVRIKCASLALHTLRAAVAAKDTTVSTE